MSRSSFIAGLLVAVVVHAILLFFPSHHQNRAPSPLVRPRTVSITPASEPPEPQLEEARHEAVSTPLPPAELHHVVRAAGEAQSSLDGDSPESDQVTVPPLTIIWDDSLHLTAVARALGLRVLAVDASQQIVAEVSLEGSPCYVPFRDELRGYSNRIRTLLPSFLQLASRTADGAAVSRLWIIVPADEDAQIVSVQREALAREGVSSNEVQSMEARFVPTVNGHALVVTAIHPSS